MKRAQVATILATLTIFCASGARELPGQTCAVTTPPVVAAPQLTHLRGFAVSEAPQGLAGRADGAIVVSDVRKAILWSLDAYGRLRGASALQFVPTAIAAGSDVLYVADADHGRVVVLDAAGQARGFLGAGEGEFLLPTAIAVDLADPRELVYVADAGRHQVRVYQKSGELLLAFGSYGSAAGQFNFPAGLLASPKGEIFVADQNNGRIQVFDRSGTFQRCFGRKSGMAMTPLLARPGALARDPEGRVYVADMFQGQVSAFDEQGAFLAHLGSFGAEPGQLMTPMALAVDPFHRLWVTSVNTGRVEVFGVEPYQDPQVLFARVWLEQPRVSPGRKATVVLFVELAGDLANGILPTSLLVDGQPFALRSWWLKDSDGNGVMDLRAQGNLPATAAAKLAAGLPVAVDGQLADGQPFHGVLRIP